MTSISAPRFSGVVIQKEPTGVSFIIVPNSELKGVKYGENTTQSLAAGYIANVESRYPEDMKQAFAECVQEKMSSIKKALTSSINNSDAPDDEKQQMIDFIRTKDPIIVSHAPEDQYKGRTKFKFER